MLAATKKQSGRLRIEYYPYMRSVMQKMNKALNRMQFEYENIHFDIDFIQPRKQASITDSVLQGYFDVAVLARTTFGPAAIEEKRGICCLPLPTLRSRICFFVANDSPLARYDEISVSELDGMEILFGMNQEFQNFQEDMRKLFSDVGICPIEVPCRINDIAEFAYSRMGERVHILTEDDLTIESSPYLTNSQCKVLRCKEDIGATPYLLYRAESDNIALDSFLSSMQQVIDAE